MLRNRHRTCWPGPGRVRMDCSIAERTSRATHAGESSVRGEADGANANRVCPRLLRPSGGPAPASSRFTWGLRSREDLRTARSSPWELFKTLATFTTLCVFPSTHSIQTIFPPPQLSAALTDPSLVLNMSQVSIAKTPSSRQQLLTATRAAAVPTLSTEQIKFQRMAYADGQYRRFTGKTLPLQQHMVMMPPGFPRTHYNPEVWDRWYRQSWYDRKAGVTIAYWTIQR